MKSLITLYVVAMATANLLVWWLGPWMSPINSFLFIGLDLALRDRIHEKSNGNLALMSSLVVGSSLLTFLINPSAIHIATASAVSFAAAATADWIVYTHLRAHPYLIRSNGSNIAGAAVDSFLFPTLAFGTFMPAVVLLQFAAKALGGSMWTWILRR